MFTWSLFLAFKQQWFWSCFFKHISQYSFKLALLCHTVSWLWTLHLNQSKWWWWLLLACEDFAGSFDKFISQLSFFFFFKVAVSSCTPIPLLLPGSVHNGSTNWDDFDQVFSDKLHVSLFPWHCDRFPTNAYTVPTPARLDQGCMHF